MADEMRIACGSVHPAVAGQPADDRQLFAERERPRGEEVPKVVDQYAVKAISLRFAASPYSKWRGYVVTGRYGERTSDTSGLGLEPMGPFSCSDRGDTFWL